MSGPPSVDEGLRDRPPGQPAPPAAPPSGRVPVATFGPGTLARQLVVRVTALVALVAILLTAATALASHTLLVSRTDVTLDSVTSRVRDPYSTSGGPGRHSDTALLRPGQPIGTLAAIFDAKGVPRDDGRLTESGATGRPVGAVVELPADVVERLGELPVTNQKSTVTLPSGLGRYRVTAVRLVSGGVAVGTVVVGVPLTEVDDTTVSLLGLAGVLSLLAIVGTVFAARSIVVRSLRPLNRVAGVAQQVSQLPLDRGEVALAVRVPPGDADPTSEVGRVGQALNHMLNNVEEALAARQASEMKVRQFVADASHELRNPLAAIRGYAELTRRDRAAMPEGSAYAMSRVESETDRMSRLVEDLLLLARLDSGPDLDLRPCDLTEIVLNAVSDARAAGPDHTWRLALPDEPVQALGDRHRLHQVVANLLANARTHTPPGTAVEATVTVAGGEALVRVTDSGPGIPAKIADRVFERFTRADASRVRNLQSTAGGSTGLGLAIVAAVVEAHHGTVGAESRPGRTEFTVRLPLVANPPAHSGPGPDMVGPG